MGSVASVIAPIALGVVQKNQEKSDQRALIKQQSAADEERRQRALKSAMATQRARFGASGIDSGDGSAEAVLLGLFQSSEEDAQARLQRDQLRMQAQGLNPGSGRNLLSVTDDVLGGNFSRIFLN